ncbi:hypothetical protein GOEFS_123_00010 [Gordonia effusa NBRC 100432]|uniref:Uncharacterized protein n=1 Tax=Gordonia effusa NBRC 100432 TaxID=1077974 RepID=H0R6G7_9ACTN|nr:hypothetical protein GOEFS_123_00010 [Gordonia effusa NBRC 100432]
MVVPLGLGGIVCPARAGMFPTIAPGIGARLSLPRASGDVPYLVWLPESTKGSAPRERGCSPVRHNDLVIVEVCPARAGMFLEILVDLRHADSLPRASGDVPSNLSATHMA